MNVWKRTLGTWDGLRVCFWLCDLKKVRSQFGSEALNLESVGVPLQSLSFPLSQCRVAPLGIGKALGGGGDRAGVGGSWSGGVLLLPSPSQPSCPSPRPSHAVWILAGELVIHSLGCPPSRQGAGR